MKAAPWNSRGEIGVVARDARPANPSTAVFGVDTVLRSIWLLNINMSPRTKFDSPLLIDLACFNSTSLNRPRLASFLLLF